MSQVAFEPNQWESDPDSEEAERDDDFPAGTAPFAFQGGLRVGPERYIRTVAIEQGSCRTVGFVGEVIFADRGGRRCRCRC